VRGGTGLLSVMPEEFFAIFLMKESDMSEIFVPLLFCHVMDNGKSAHKWLQLLLQSIVHDVLWKVTQEHLHLGWAAVMRRTTVLLCDLCVASNEPGGQEENGKLL
jgi:hypothetical protein